MQLPIFQVDAFAGHVFAGNPAAVCPLETWLSAETMQAIAVENNLSETAFFVRGDKDFHIRWFTPEYEIDLCGHATLASAHILFTELAPDMDSVTFQSQSGPLTVTRRGNLLVMDFPAWIPEPATPHPALLQALGGPAPQEVLATRDYLVVYAHQADVEALAPDFGLLKQVDKLGVIVTAPGDAVDFVSRFFAPGAGIAEDPVTGSAHSTLTPYWSAKLGKPAMTARQLSARGGELACELTGDRAIIAGAAVTYMQGTITI